MTDTNTIEFYNTYAQSFTNKIASLNIYTNSYNKLIELAPKQGTLLDLACGPANVSTYIHNKLPKLEITCIDLSDAMLQIAKEKLPQATFYKSNIIDLQIPAQTYDVVVCAFGLPYVEQKDIPLFIQQIKKHTHANSIIYISCMQGNSSQIEKVSFGKDEQLLIHYHTKNNLLKAFKNEGFKLTEYIEQDYPEQDGSCTTDMIIIFQK